jgi:hypothetical protein
MVGGKTIFEVLFGEPLSDELLASQPIQEILFESLIYDNELEEEHIEKSYKKSKNGKSDKYTIPTSSKVDVLFRVKYPEVQDEKVVVTLLTTEEYLKIGG